MKFLLTMNMPSGQGNLVHQVIFEHSAEDCSALCRIMNDEVFITGRQFYRRQNPVGDPFWVDRGDIVLNTAHIGKVQQFVEYERDTEDETYGNSGSRNVHVETTRGPLRPRRNSF